MGRSASPIHVAYRIRYDLGTLRGERPRSSRGRGEQGHAGGPRRQKVALTGGRAHRVDRPHRSIAGSRTRAKTLTRQVPYTFTPHHRPARAGVVSVRGRHRPLAIERPARAWSSTRRASCCAGRTARGAQILAGGRPIAVRPDGIVRARDERLVRGRDPVRGAREDAGHGAAHPRRSRCAASTRIETAAEEFAGRAHPGTPSSPRAARTTSASRSR